MTAGDDLNLRLIQQQIEALTKITELRFTNLENDLRDVKGLPERVSRLETRFGDGIRRLETLENSGVRRADWGRGALPTIVLTFALVLVGVAQALSSVLH